MSINTNIINSTGIYGNTSILNSEIYTDIFNDIEDINTNKIPNLILDISNNLNKIKDISVELSIAFLKYSPLVIILVVSSNASSEFICKSDELTLDKEPKF
jgi:hypothetical protein